MRIKSKYSHLNDQGKVRLKRLKNQTHQFAWLRFFSLLIGSYFIYKTIETEAWYYFVPGLLFLVLFFYFVSRHLSLKADIKYQRAYLNEIDMELKYLSGTLPNISFAGREFVNQQHYFTHDLDIFGEYSMYHHLNRCFSFPGRQMLASQFENPSPGKIKELQDWNRELSQKIEWMLAFRTTGRMGVGADEVNNRMRLWLNKVVKPSWTRNPVLLYALSAIAVGLAINFALHPSANNFLFLNFSLLFNLAYTFRQFKTIKSEHESLNYVSKPLSILSKIVVLIEGEEFESAYAKKLLRAIKGETGKASSKALQSLSKIVAAMEQINNAVVLVFLNGIFLFHLHTLNSLEKWKAKFKGKLPQWLELINRLEADVSKAGYTANHSHFSYPEIADEPHFAARDLAHPLIAETKAVPNNLNIENWRFAVLTGSNMSGKSTFLKTLGLSILMARMGLPVFATKLKVYPFKLLTSMKLVDSISREESYFQAEVLRLKAIKEEIGIGNTAFLLLDEILRGTNSDDKRSGTRQFMQNLAQSAAWGFLATHDTDISDLSGSQPAIFKPLYFESKVEAGHLLFDYKLREGVCATPNATQLMRDYGII